ncbi:MAG: hypothetical protein V3W41_21915 [Planctomycetota bacterium]
MTDEILGAEATVCRCKVQNDGGKFTLPAENMVDDCPMHGADARARLEADADMRGPFKFTFLGERFYPLSPHPDDIKLEDIAHGLALTCRFGGSCKVFYSVAQHSVHVSEQMESHYLPHWMPDMVAMSELQIVQCMHGLMHDASEAYLGDVIAPIKALPGMADYRVTEAVVQMCVTSCFGLPDVPSQLLHLVDARMLLTEARDLLNGEFPPANVEPYDFEVSPMGPMVAEARFLDRFHELEAGLRHVRGLR